MTKYPTKKVIGLYALLGGAIGGVLFLLLAVVISPDIITDTDAGIVMMGFMAFLGFGMIFGCIPAFFTGLFLAWRRFYINSRKPVQSYCMLFIIGFVVTSLVFGGLPDIISSDINSKLPNLILMGFNSLLGGASAVITGIIVLPKRLDNAQK